MLEQKKVNFQRRRENILVPWGTKPKNPDLWEPEAQLGLQNRFAREERAAAEHQQIGGLFCFSEGLQRNKEGDISSHIFPIHDCIRLSK